MRLLKRRISLYVNPIGCSRGHMARFAIHFEICRCGFRGITSIEPRPTPSITPQGTIRMAVLAVLDHYEPALQCLGAAYDPCFHLSGSRLKYLLDQNRAIRKTPVLTVRRNGTGRCVNDVQLSWTLACLVRYCPTSQEMVRGAIAGRHPHVSIRVDHRTRGQVVLLCVRLSIGSD